MKAFVHQYCSLSVLPSLETGLLPNIRQQNGQQLREPEYKNIIPAAQLRRMSKVIRMGAAAALNAASDHSIQGIVVGTGLGCFENSVIFAEEYLSRPEGALSPTAFIQSTDNTIAGQIALILQNHAYNITYSHKGIAFENALLDAMLLCHEVTGDILVGGVDERMELFAIDEEKGNVHNYWLGEGATFFRLSKEKTNALALVELCTTTPAGNGSIRSTIENILTEFHLPMPDMILYGNSFLNRNSDLQNMDVPTFNYSEICGIYYSNSAFGMQLATEILADRELAKRQGFQAKRILVLNNFNDTDYGLNYLSDTGH